MKPLKGTKTESNLQAAFAGESQARNKYTYFSAVAKQEGYLKVASIFKENAKNEKEHAKLWFKLLSGINDTASNLKAAAAGENYEATQMYVDFAKTAKEEGFDDIAKLFEQVAAIEASHEQQFKQASDSLGKETEVSSPVWRCVNCGFTLNAKSAPSKCSVCGEEDIPWSGAKAFRISK